MVQINVVNPKGGCGKTTVAVQLAGCYANREKRVLLIDRDCQKSSSDWYAGRPYQFPAIEVKSLPAQEVCDPSDFDVVIQDFPAAAGFEHIDLTGSENSCFIIPVLSSPNDIKACLRFVMGMNRSGVLEQISHLGVVTNRVKGNTHYINTLNLFLDRLGLNIIGEIRDSQNYVKVMDRGLTIFDIESSRTKRDREQWQPILTWLEEHTERV